MKLRGFSVKNELQYKRDQTKDKSDDDDDDDKCVFFNTAIKKTVIDQVLI